MDKIIYAIILMAMLPASIYSQEISDSVDIDSIANYWDKVLELNEVVVLGHRTVLKQSPDRIVYLTKNDTFAKGLNGIEVLDRIPRVTVEGDAVTVAGKSSVRYIVDGRLQLLSNDIRISEHHSFPPIIIIVIILCIHADVIVHNGAITHRFINYKVIDTDFR